MLESAVEQVFNRRVRQLGGRSFKVPAVNAGIPDRMVLMPGGKIYLVELKTDTGTVSKVQQLWHARALELGTRVYIVRGSKEAREWTP